MIHGPAEFEIDFDEHRVPCHAGDTIAAALTASGHYVLGAAGSEKRGVFCGMGVCQACAVEVDGRGVRRACMERVTPGMRVRRNTPGAAAAGFVAADETAEPPVDLRPDLLVIGGGPAGLTAACRAAELGVGVVVIDERSQPGGQYYKQPGGGRPTPEKLVGDRQFVEGKALIDQALRAGVRIVSGATLWGAFPGPELAVTIGERSQVFKPRRLLVATGAYESGVPVPGWQLPRVMTVGAAQTLLRSYGVKAGQRILVAGNGPLNLQVALELQRAGADIVLLAELAPMFDAKAARNLLRMFLATPTIAMQGAALMTGLRAAGVPFRRGWGVAAVHEQGESLSVEVGPAGDHGVNTAQSLSVDVLCLGYGFLPNNEALRMLGCRHDYDSDRCHLVTVRNEHCETSVGGVYAIGDCCGLGGAPAAMEEGAIAAAAIVESLDRPINAEARTATVKATSRLRSHRRFQQALWQLFSNRPPGLDWANADTLLCRCENVTLADVRAAIEGGDVSMAAIKQRTRLGMGGCQGRYCTRLALQLLHDKVGGLPDEFSQFAAQPPFKPLSIDQLSADDVAE